MMKVKVMIYEEDRRKRWHMMRVIRQAQPGVSLYGFRDAAQAIQFAEQEKPEAAFISLENEDGRGYFLIKKLRRVSPRTNVIAVSGTYRFEAELMRLRISGYVTEAFTREKVIDEMENLRYRDEETEQMAAL